MNQSLNKTYTPYKLIHYLFIEFLSSLLIVVVVFFALSLLISFVEELIFFKDKKIENLTWMVLYISLSKTPATLIELSIFIFLFSGIIFFAKFQKNNEINTILLAGISKNFSILVPAITSFALGLFIVFFLTPLSSNFLKFYEKTKRIYSLNDNLIMVNDTGLWFMETTPFSFNIIRADKILNNDFTKLNNVTIYNLDENFNFIKRYDSKKILINKKNWQLEGSRTLNASKKNKIESQSKIQNTNFISTLDINSLKNYFTNVDTVSFWDINKNINTLNSRGYSADEHKVRYHKYLSLPLYLFGMIFLSTVFTIGMKKEYNTFMYLFFGTILGFVVYFLSDLSVAIGLSNKLPLAVSVWSPIILILLFSIINLVAVNEKNKR